MSAGIFRDKRAVVSGATGTIGFAIARRIIQEGGSATLIGRREAPLEAAVATLGERAAHRIVDVDLDQEVASLAADVESVDVLVCTAGWTVIGPVDETPVAEAVAMFNARFFGQCRLVANLLPKMAEGGIILLCSGVGNTSFYPYYAYGSAVAGAIEGFAKHLAGELAPRKIRVNVISPGWTVSERADLSRAARTFLNDPSQNQQFRMALDSPMHEVVDPEEFAEALAFAAKSRHLTGQVIAIDAGRSVTDGPLDGATDPYSYGFKAETGTS